MRTLSKSFLVVAGLLSQAPAVDPAIVRPPQYDGDPRLVRIREFFLKHGSPVHNLASEFLVAADNNSLEWASREATVWMPTPGYTEVKT